LNNYFRGKKTISEERVEERELRPNSMTVNGFSPGVQGTHQARVSSWIPLEERVKRDSKKSNSCGGGKTPSGKKESELKKKMKGNQKRWLRQAVNTQFISIEHGGNA